VLSWVTGSRRAAHAYSPSYPNRSEVFRLVQYCASRSVSPGPVGLNFGGDCAEIDQADAMLADLREVHTQSATARSTGDRWLTAGGKGLAPSLRRALRLVRE
jgi:hypothetical protein